MKPLNYNETGCSPISSQCVIWQGPSIDCLNLCTGDTVTDVIYKLAVEVCAIMESMSLTEYNDALACFNLHVAPITEFPTLINFILERICKLENCTGCIPDCEGDSTMVLPDSVTTPCCDTLMDIAPCFYYTDGLGDTVSQLSLFNYVHAIGLSICDIIDVNNTQDLLIIELSGRVQNLENQPLPVYHPPTMVPSCVMPPVATNPFTVLIALEAQFCALQAATGTPIEIYAAIPTPAGLNTSPQLCGEGNMSAIVGWNDIVGNMAATISNMWLTIMDLRCAVQNALLCCPSGCDAVVITMTAVMQSSTLKLYFTGTLPSGYTDCSITGSPVTITDSNGGTMTNNIVISSYMNTGTSYNIDLAASSVNPVLDLTISSVVCMKNDDLGTLCERCVSTFLENTALCPSVSYAQTNTTIQYFFNTTNGLKTYALQVWSNDGSTMITSQTFSSSIVEFKTGTFVGLTPNTTYRLRMVITVGTNVTTCPDVPVTTMPLACDPPENVTAELDFLPT